MSSCFDYGGRQVHNSWTQGVSIDGKQYLVLFRSGGSEKAAAEENNVLPLTQLVIAIVAHLTTPSDTISFNQASLN